MNSIESIKRHIEKLYRTAPSIHISINMTHPRLTVYNACATIKGVYPNLFLIEERDAGYPRLHSLSYTDVFIKQIEIHELKTGKDAF